MSTVNLIQASLPHLARAGGLGSVVVIGSVSGHDLDFSAPGPYGSFKAALTHYVQGQARANAAPEKGPVRFNTVSPGNVYFDPGFWAQTERDNPAFFKQCLEANPMKRMATPEEVANAVLFLASKVSAFTVSISFPPPNSIAIAPPSHHPILTHTVWHQPHRRWSKPPRCRRLRLAHVFILEKSIVCNCHKRGTIKIIIIGTVPGHPQHRPELPQLPQLPLVGDSIC